MHLLITFLQKNRAVTARLGILLTLLVVFGFLQFRSYVSFGEHAGDARTIFRTCSSDQGSDRENCYSKAFEGFAREHGSVEAFRVLLTLQTIDPSSVGCHFIAHGIGYGTYQRDPMGWQEDFRNISQECTYGAMHGVLELAIADLPGGLTKEMLPQICGENPRGDCNHIVGHLALVETGASIPDALKLCEALRSGQYEECASGVFMEYETATNLVAHGLADTTYFNWKARLPQLKKLCNIQASMDQVPCWEMLAYVITDAFNQDPEASFSACAEAPTNEAHEKCLSRSVGILVTYPGIGTQERLHICSLFPGDEKTCFSYVVNTLTAAFQKDSGDLAGFCTALPPSEKPELCTNLLP